MEVGQTQQKEASRPARPLRRFVIVWLAVVLGLAGIVFPAVTMFLLNWHSDSTTRWIYETRRRKLRMTELEKGADRILIAGGSSGFFSLDAELLTAKLGRPVLNLSTHAGLGRRFFLQDLRQTARQGDTILLNLEYALYGPNAEKVQELERKFLWTHDPRRILSLGWPLAPQQIYGNPYSDYRDSWARWNARFSGSPTPGDPTIWPGYSFTELSPRGDLRNTPPWTAEIKPLSIEANRPLATTTKEKLTDFLSWAKNNGIQVIAMLPAVARAEGAGSENVLAYATKIERFYQRVGVRVVSVPELKQIPKEFCLDTEYHANAAGRRVITERLGLELRKVLGLEAKGEGEPFTYLVHSPTARDQASLSFAGNPRVECRYLSTQDLRHPLSLSVNEVREAATAGKRFRFADPAVAKLLREAGMTWRSVERKQTSARDWLQRYPQHVFAVVAIGDKGRDLAIPVGEKPFDEVLPNSGAYRAAWIGSGRYAKTRKILAGDQPVELLRATGTNWPAKNGVAMEVRIRSATTYAWDKGEGPLLLDRHRLFDGSETGLGIAVIEPERGIVVDQRVLGSPEFIEYELAEIVGHAH